MEPIYSDKLAVIVTNFGCSFIELRSDKAKEYVNKFIEFSSAGGIYSQEVDFLVENATEDDLQIVTRRKEDYAPYNISSLIHHYDPVFTHQRGTISFSLVSEDNINLISSVLTINTQRNLHKSSYMVPFGQIIKNMKYIDMLGPYIEVKNESCKKKETLKLKSDIENIGKDILTLIKLSEDITERIEFIKSFYKIGALSNSDLLNILPKNNYNKAINSIEKIGISVHNLENKIKKIEEENFNKADTYLDKKGSVQIIKLFKDLAFNGQYGCYLPREREDIGERKLYKIKLPDNSSSNNYCIDQDNILLLKLDKKCIVIEMMTRVEIYDGVKWKKIFVAENIDDSINHKMISFFADDHADSQFFINIDDNTVLDKEYNQWGRVISGIENLYTDNQILTEEMTNNPIEVDLFIKLLGDISSDDIDSYGCSISFSD